MGAAEDVSAYDTHELYEHEAEGEVRPPVATDGYEDRQNKVPVTELDARRRRRSEPVTSPPEAITLPALRARWTSNRTGAQATVSGWADDEGGPVALLEAPGAEGQPTAVEPGTLIIVRLKRPVVNPPSGTLAGFMGEGPGGMAVPVPVDALSVPLRNPGLIALTGQEVKLTVMDRVLSGGLLVSRLVQVEQDLEEFADPREVDGRVVEIVKDRQGRGWVNLAIDRPEGTVHAATLSFDNLPPEIRTQVMAGEKVRLRAQCWKLEAGKRWEVELYEGTRVTSNDEIALKESRISHAHGVLSTTERLRIRSILPLLRAVPHLFHLVRRLYARTQGLGVAILETEASLKTVEALKRQAFEILRRADTDAPSAVHPRIESFRMQIKEAQIGQSSRRRLHDIASQAWRIQKIRHHQQEIAKLTEWLRTTRDAQKAEQRKQYVAEHRREIQRLAPEVEDWKPPEM